MQEDLLFAANEVGGTQTEALVGFYTQLAEVGTAGAPKYRSISGIGSIEAITQRVFSALR